MGELMTKASYAKLKKQIEILKKKRAKISKAIGEAREEGDIKENAGYHAAKEEQGLNEMKIRDLESKLENADIVAENKMPKKDRVVLNATVKAKDLDSGDVFTYTIVPAVDADVFENKISTESPIGAALMGCKKGEVVKVEVPRGLIKIKVLEIK